MAKDTYLSDVSFLRQHTEIIELPAGRDAAVAVAPAYQGRVMTSTLAGPRGRSFGWLHRRFIASGADDVQFNNYGGEDRFWLGPEGGQFALFFHAGEPFDLPHWKTPPGFNTGAFEVIRRGKDSVTMARRMDVANCAGTMFCCLVRRTIAVLSRTKARQALRAVVPPAVKMVAFESRNTLTNAGVQAWNPDGGMVSIWILGQFKPLPRGKVIVPFKPGEEGKLGPKATTNYFGQIPPSRCRVGEDLLLLKCDGKYRSKIGISPARARSVLGSYDPDGKVLTIAQFNLPRGAAGVPYVNSLWEMQDRPFGGDVVNSYNDGPATPGAGQLGPFYELETSSPAAELEPGHAITHIHRTFHFAGPAKALAALAKKVLGADLKDIR